MATTKSAGQKHDLDKLYTTDTTARWCLSKLCELYPLEQFAKIVEPSAGGGAFLRALQAEGVPVPVVAYDLLPEGDDIEQADWFDVTLAADDPVLVLGNPPYGQQNKLAVAFINHAAAQPCVNTIAFILPRSFNKQAVQARIHPNFIPSASFDLPDTTFMLEGAGYKVPTIFQVWTRQSSPRPLPVRGRTTSSLFSIVKSPMDADLRIQRVGGRAGKASTDLDRSGASNYWVKLDKTVTIDQLDDFIQLVNGLTFPTINDTVGPRSLPLAELVEVVETGWMAHQTTSNRKVNQC